MLLQFAADSPESLAVIPQVKDSIDIVEVGTPLLKRFGLSAISTASALSGGLPVLADTKTMDGGGIEADMVFQAGARFMTVLACASSETLRSAEEAAERHDGFVVVDTLGHPDPADCLGRHRGARVGFILLHSGYDLLEGGSVRADEQAALLRSSATVPGAPVAVAGGINAGNIGELRDVGVSLVIAGSSISTAADPASAARELRAGLADAGLGLPWASRVPS